MAQLPGARMQLILIVWPSEQLSSCAATEFKPLSVAAVLVCSLASALACLALRPLSFSLTIICGVRSLHSEPDAGRELAV